MTGPPDRAFPRSLSGTRFRERVQDHDDPVSRVHVVRVQFQRLPEPADRLVHLALVLQAPTQCVIREGFRHPLLDQRADDGFTGVVIALVVQELCAPDVVHKLLGDLRPRAIRWRPA